jgi:vacuolar fusion protein MON1
LPLVPTIRDSITNAIKTSCYKIQNLVFGIIIANNKLVGVVSMKKFQIHPSDLRLLINMIGCTESYKTSEGWVPICLPKFNPNGHLYAHISYLAESSVSIT